MITWCCIMQWNMPWWKLHFFCYIGPIEMNYIQHKNLLMITKFALTILFLEKLCRKWEAKHYQSYCHIPLPVEIACDLWTCRNFGGKWALLGDIMMNLVVMMIMMMIVMFMMIVVTDDYQDYDRSGVVLWI